MPRAGEGVGGGPPRFRHGWIPVGVSVAEVQRTAERIRARRQPDLQHEITAHGGFTFNPRTGKLLKPGTASGYAVAVPGTEQAVGSGHLGKAEFRKAMADVIMNHKAEIDNGAVVGGWYSADRDQYMVELTHVLPPDQREAAIREGQRRNQEAIFDLATGETIPTGGTGDIRVTGLPKTPREQAAIKAENLLLDARRAEPQITNDLRNVTEHLGGRMEGLDFKFKGLDSLTRKLVDKSAAKGMTVEEYGNYVSDALRYTSMFSEDEYASGVGGVLNDLTKRGYKLIDVQNTWSPDSPYKGINTNVIAPNGQVFELQFHTKESFDAKMAQHVLYEQERNPKLPPEIRQAATRKMKENMARVPVPARVSTLGVGLMGLPGGTRTA